MRILPISKRDDGALSGNMSVLDTLDISATDLTIYDLGIRSDGQVLCGAASGTDSIFTIDISTPSSLSFLDSVTHADLNGVQGCCFSISDDFIYAAGFVSDYASYVNATTPSALTYVARRGTFNGISGVAALADDESVTVSKHGNEINTFLYNGVSSPIELDSASNSFWQDMTQVEVTDDYGYALTVAATNSRIIICDLSNTSSIAATTLYHADLSGATGVAINDDDTVLAIANGTKVILFDISSLPTVTHLTTYTNATVFTGLRFIAITGDIAVVTDVTDAKVSTIDISDTSNLSIIDTIAPSGLTNARGVKIYNGVAFVGDADSIRSISLNG